MFNIRKFLAVSNKKYGWILVPVLVHILLSGDIDRMFYLSFPLWSYISAKIVDVGIEKADSC
jgi:hypothetical protein